MAGTTVAFMICSIIYSLIKLFTRTPCWSSMMFCRFTKCENDNIKVVYKYRIHDEVAGYEVSEYNEFYVQYVQSVQSVVAADQQVVDNCKDDNELIHNYDGSEEESVSDDGNSSYSVDSIDSVEECETPSQTEEEIDISPFVVNCLEEFETKQFKPSVKKYFYFVEMDDLKTINNYEAKKLKKIPSKNPKKNPWYGKDIKIRPCPDEYKKPWWTRVDPAKY